MLRDYSTDAEAREAHNLTDRSLWRVDVQGGRTEVESDPECGRLY